MHNDDRNDHNDDVANAANAAIAAIAGKVGGATQEITHEAKHEAKQDALCALRHLAFGEARHMQLDEDDAHDCAMEFVLRAMQQEAAQAASVVSTVTDDPSLVAPIVVSHIVLRLDLPPEQTTFWLRKCAHNFASNWRRSILCRKRYETACSDAGFNVETLSLLPSARYAVSAEDAAFSRLLRHDIYAACGQLPPASRVLFERFHLHEDSMAEIALSAGKSEEAIKQSVYRLRRHVRTTLYREGYESL